MDSTIDSGCRTVLSVTEHFEVLKQRARELGDAAAASQRGYFTPSEDEEIKHLLVSYWQSRNALIELVLNIQRARATSVVEQNELFLVGFSGALVLIDAARFLRDHFHDVPIVRGKLNEPDPYFGIEADTYEKIQKSLTNPMHVWRLYHATKYFKLKHVEIRQQVRADLYPLLELIEKLQSRLDVTLERYSVARARARARELNRIAGAGLFSQAVYGLQKLVASWTATLFVKRDHIPKLRDDVAIELRKHLLPGDVMITRKEFAVTNYFLPGYWPHAALYLGSSDDLQKLGIDTHENMKPRWQKLLGCDQAESLRVLEAMADGVHIRSVKSPFGVDAITVLRPQLPQADIISAITRGLFHEGKPYDFDFDFNRSDRLVCTEVIYRSYEKVGGVEFQLTRRAGRWTLAAEDLIRMSLQKNFLVPHAVFSATHDPQLSLGADAERVLRLTMQGRLAE